MKNIPTYKNINELIDTLKQMKKEGCSMEEEITFFPIQPVRIGDKIGVVDWVNANWSVYHCSRITIENSPLFATAFVFVKVINGVC